jgi:signal transduction histidine kinase
MQEKLDRLRLEVAELRASRERLVLAADAARRTIERELHDGVQQHLVALSVNLQLASGLVDTDPDAAKALVDEMGRDVQQALDEAARLAQRIHPPLLEAGGLAAALHVAAASAGTPAEVDVAWDVSYLPEVAATVYACFLATLEHAGAAARATVTVREEEASVAFDIAVDGSLSAAATHSNADLDGVRDRVESLGGRLTIRPEPGGIRVSGSLPLSR